MTSPAATAQPAAAARGVIGCGGPERASGPAAVTMEHVLLVLWETEAEREARIRGVFGFFDADAVRLRRLRRRRSSSSARIRGVIGFFDAGGSAMGGRVSPHAAATPPHAPLFLLRDSNLDLEAVRRRRTRPKREHDLANQLLDVMPTKGTVFELARQPNMIQSVQA